MFNISADMSYQSYETCTDSKLRELLRDRMPSAPREELIKMLQAGDEAWARQYDGCTDHDLIEIASDRGLAIGNSRYEIIQSLRQADKPPTGFQSVLTSEMQDAAQSTAFKIGCVKYLNHEPEYWKKCDARIEGKLCNKSQKVSFEEYKSEKNYMCIDCTKKNRSFQK